MKNTKVALDKNVENAELRTDIEQKEKENVELQLEHNSLRDRVKILGKEMSQSKTASNTMQDLQELKYSNQNLKLQVENLLQ